ncbi:hypothetical protein PS467_01850 [Streptomyces luomodiensis]|uniref:Uncharacterized protein n=1 Tax=Streptomyces luomodiensis TaxID=3026192 RepID=A0ABY9UNM7_9ACTN|nr:hypothetical protein [Streptomyces sp. SCA4-21]WNE94152.1 hypothetical protein PS467_01850 [Streptomyces sp. SCA4-21]
MNTTSGPVALAATLEERLGDPYDPANPYGFRAILAAREARQPLDDTPFDAFDAIDAIDVIGAADGDDDPEALLHALRAGYRRSPALTRTGHTARWGSGAMTAGAAVGTLDSGLRMTLRHLRTRRLYGAAAVDIPQLRAVLAGAYADLLLCDALTTLAARGTDVLPTRPGAHAELVRALVPRVLQGAMDRLSIAMGSRFYITEGEHAAFPLLLNEMQASLFTAAGRPARPAAPADTAPLTGITVTDLVTAPAITALYDPELLAAAPGGTLTTRARRTPQPTGPAQERLYAELNRRYDTGRSFDLAERSLPDRP